MMKLKSWEKYKMHFLELSSFVERLIEVPGRLKNRAVAQQPRNEKMMEWLKLWVETACLSDAGQTSAVEKYKLYTKYKHCW